MSDRRVRWIALIGAVLLDVGCGGALGGNEASVDGSKADAGSLATLFQHDPITSALNLKSGAPGLRFQDGRLMASEAHIEYGNYEANAFTVGIRGGDKGAIVDLGSTETLKNLYGFAETSEPGQGFASICRTGGSYMIAAAGEDGANGKTQLLKESARLSNISSCASAEVVDGHIYLVRVAASRASEEEIVVKLIVVDAKPGVYATFRWVRI